MNNTCPSCGALYNVASKDIGRKIKCKKCSAALRVTDAGLELDNPTGSAPPADARPVVPAAADLDDEDADDEPRPRKRRRDREDRGPRVNPLTLLAPIGGVPGVLFCIGVFFALFFTSLQVLSGASNERAAQYVKKLELEREIKIRKLLPKGKNDPRELEGSELTKFNDDKKKVEDEYVPLLQEAEADRQATEIGNKRSKLYEGYGQMVGFLLIGLGCLGFLMSESALILRIVAGVILASMVIGLFKLAIGASGGVNTSIGIG